MLKDLDVGRQNAKLKGSKKTCFKERAPATAWPLHRESSKFWTGVALKTSAKPRLEHLGGGRNLFWLAEELPTIFGCHSLEESILSPTIVSNLKKIPSK